MPIVCHAPKQKLQALLTYPTEPTVLEDHGASYETAYRAMGDDCEFLVRAWLAAFFVILEASIHNG